MSEAEVENGGPARAWLELLRLPNVFTAIADVAMGYFFTHEYLFMVWPVFGLLVGASASLYLAGMVLNDVFDVRQDAAERPSRPIPSGRISIGSARIVGFGLIFLGVALGWGAAAMSGHMRAGIVATLLAALVVGYDAIFKRTPLGPIAMGGCRTLNVLLGMSMVEGPWHKVHWVIAVGLGAYVAGITWFARTEARTSSRPILAAALVLMLAALVSLAGFPRFADEQLVAASQPVQVDSSHWYLMWTMIAALIGWRCAAAIREPIPERVQVAVRTSIHSLIVLDAAICYSARGSLWAFAVIVLLFPTVFLGRWIYST